MPRDIPSLKETYDTLERQKTILKRHIRETREMLATVCHAQAHILGIEVETLPTPHSHLPGGHSDITDQAGADDRAG